MTAVLDRPQGGDTLLGPIEHLICGDCYPDYVPGRMVRGLCGAETPDIPNCTLCTDACSRGCVDGRTCAMCVMEIESGVFCQKHSQPV